jgi:predicted nuclease of predicted toxin-antitoxin system
VIKILIDENLPATLGALLPCESLHATSLGAQPSDLYLWEFALRGGWTLLTKDADFFEQLALSGAPPKVIWVRTGNLRRIELERRLLVLWPKIIAMAESHDLVEIHTDKIEGIYFGPS